MNYEDITFNDFMTKLANKLNEIEDDFNKLSFYNKERIKIATKQAITGKVLYDLFFPNNNF